MPRFDLYGHGQEAMREGEIQEDVLDSLRWFCEECDSLQSFVIPADINAGFGSCAKEILTELADFYPRTPKFLMGLSPPDSQSLSHIYDVNAALCTALLPELVSLYSPIKTRDWTSGYFPQLNLNTGNYFETSAVVATAWDTIGVPWRLSRDGTSVSRMSQSLVRRSNANTACMDMAMPLPPNPKDYRKGDYGRLVNLSVDTSRLPRCREEDDDDYNDPPPPSSSFSEYVVLRGLQIEAEKEEQIQAYMKPCRHRQSFLWEEPMRVPIPYPQYFLSDRTGPKEALSEIDRSGKGGSEKLVHKKAAAKRGGPEGEDVGGKPPAMQDYEVLPVLARLHCGSDVQLSMRHMAHQLDAAMAYGSVKASFVSTGLEVDEFEEAKERLLQGADEYDEA